MLEKVRQTIAKYNMLSPGDSVLLALSGGPDSVCLLDCLLSLKEKLGVTVFAAHVNHMLRGEASDRDEAFVKTLCGRKNVPLFVKRIDIFALAKEKKISTELAARVTRYQFFEETCREREIAKIATAHQLDDHAETVFFNLIRGAGLKGMSGIAPVRGNIVRPLLFVSRREIEYYIEENHLSFVSDETNFENIYTRNQIRHTLIPLAKKLNPSFLDSVKKSAHIARAANDYVTLQAKEAFRRLATAENGSVFLSLEGYLSLHEALKFPVISLCVREAGAENPTFDLFEEIEKMAFSKTVSKRRAFQNIVVQTTYGGLIFEKFSPKENDFFFCRKLSENQGRFFSKREKFRIFYEIQPLYTEIIQKKLNTAVLDCGKIKTIVYARERKKGDRYTPLGFSGSKSVKKMMIDKKIPRTLRDEIPVFADEEGILWVPGFPVCERCKTDENTKLFLYIEVSEV